MVFFHYPEKAYFYNIVHGMGLKAIDQPTIICYKAPPCKRFSCSRCNKDQFLRANHTPHLNILKDYTQARAFARGYENMPFQGTEKRMTICCIARKI